jgi:indolepyruvate ferredoxin oxidoreductase alpha subunit
VLCPGCPHRGVFYVISKLGAIVTSDIGCYSLGVAPPLNALETCICMGASIGNALGMSKMLPDKKVIATIGDSTFIHSGITGLIDVVYNKGILTVVILDNSITGMTGHQHHPGTGFTVKNEPTYKVDLEQLVKAAGIKHIWTVNAYDLTAVEQALQEATTCAHPAVVITKQPCALIDKQLRPVCVVNEDTCKHCKQCMKIGCPAIENKAGKMIIHDTLCTGCTVCQQICKFGAIEKAGDKHE